MALTNLYGTDMYTLDWQTRMGKITIIIRGETVILKYHNTNIEFVLKDILLNTIVCSYKLLKI